MDSFEQISLFGERDPFSIAVEGINEMFRLTQKWGATDFWRWLFDLFSSYYGGSADGFFEDFAFFEFSPQGLRLQNWPEGKDELIPKVKILRYFDTKGRAKHENRAYRR